MSEFPKNASIRLSDSNTEILLQWSRFDGDDCFDEHHVVILQGGRATKHEFGECAVAGLREWTRFFDDPLVPEVSGGFRNPDIISCRAWRKGQSFHLSVNYEERNRIEDYQVTAPEIVIDRAFIKMYDGEE